MKDFWAEVEEENITKTLNKKKLIIVAVLAVALIIFIVISIIYNTNKPFREWIDKNIFRKEVLQDRVATIDLKNFQESSVIAFNKYIGILNKNTFTIYGNTGNKEKELELQISNPVFDSANRFLAVAESKGQKVCLITDKDISWENSVEGNVAQIHVNKNGYVAVVIVDTSYKTVISMYSPNGKELFKTYLSSTRTADVTISNDNKHLAIAEVDTSGTIIQSNIKIISVDKASTDPTNSLEKIYNSENGKLISNIEYEERNKLVCMYTDSIDVIENDQTISLVDNKDKKVICQSIELSNNVVSIEEKSSGLFTADSLVKIININSKNTKEYTADSVTKEIFTYGDIIALNLGTEVEFINTSGWLVKRYVANQEITNIVVSDSIAGIIYRDKIEIINL